MPDYIVEKISMPVVFDELDQSGITIDQLSKMTGISVTDINLIKEEKRSDNPDANNLAVLAMNLWADKKTDIQQYLRETVHLLLTLRCMKKEMVCKYLQISEDELRLIVTDYHRVDINSLLKVVRLERTLSLISSINRKPIADYIEIDEHEYQSLFKLG